MITLVHDCFASSDPLHNTTNENGVGGANVLETEGPQEACVIELGNVSVMRGAALECSRCVLMRRAIPNTDDGPRWNHYQRTRSNTMLARGG